jgi:hypothetical protein
MRILKRLIAVIILLGAGFLAFMYWGTYEEGVMAGKVLRISQKGYIFKTYEGKISLESFGALKGVSPVAETFDFSVEKNQQEIIKSLETVALSGERVNLHFVKRYWSFPWRGETKYFIVSVDKSELP